MEKRTAPCAKPGFLQGPHGKKDCSLVEVWLTKSHEILTPNEMCDFGKVCLTALHKAMGFLLVVYNSLHVDESTKKKGVVPTCDAYDGMKLY